MIYSNNSFRIIGRVAFAVPNNLLSIQLFYWESHNSPLYLGRGGVNCRDVPIIIGKREKFWETSGAVVSYLLFQYDSWTAEDALMGFLPLIWDRMSFWHQHLYAIIWLGDGIVFYQI